LTAWLVARKLLLPYVGLPNVLAGRFVVPEFLQTQATPHNLAQAALNLFDDTVTRRRLEALFAGFAKRCAPIPARWPAKRSRTSSRRQGWRAELRHRRGGPRASCGPVFAAAVILDPGKRIRGLRDSKVLAPERREALAGEIRARPSRGPLRPADVHEIDAINILQATLLAMRRAVEALSRRFRWKRSSTATSARAFSCPVHAIVKGDRDVASISAASILAEDRARLR
jgi:hypothetical protein